MRERNHFQLAQRRPVTMARSQPVSLSSRPSARRVPNMSSDGFGAPILAKKFDLPKTAPTKQTLQPIKPSQLQKNRQHAPVAIKRPIRYVPQARVQPATKKPPVSKMPVRPAQGQKYEVREKRSWFAWLGRMSKPQMAIVGAAVMIFTLGLSVSFLGYKTNSHVEAQTKKLSQGSQEDENAGDHPDESDPGNAAVGSYTTDPSFPKRITISKIGVNARVKPLGTKSTNELKAPANIYDTGWYQDSSKPGENGAMLIDGHVHGPTKAGVFYNLKKLAEGDMIEVERGDGQVFKYKVVKKQVYDRNSTDMAAAVTSVQPGKQGLNLMTCTGSLEKGNATYDQRLLVQAVIVD